MGHDVTYMSITRGHNTYSRSGMASHRQRRRLCHRFQCTMGVGRPLLGQEMIRLPKQLSVLWHTCVAVVCGPPKTNAKYFSDSTGPHGCLTINPCCPQTLRFYVGALVKLAFKLVMYVNARSRGLCFAPFRSNVLALPNSPARSC